MAVTLLRTAATPTLQKAVDTRRLCVTAAVSTRDKDKAGDIVEPRGVAWNVHKADPWAGYEHYRWNNNRTDWGLPGESGVSEIPVVVGRARDPDTGEHTAVLKAMPGYGDVWFVTTHFDPTDRLSAQTFELIDRGVMEGTSIEFTLRKGQYSELHRSPIENRPAYHVRACDAVGYAHCRVPVNPAALIAKSLPPAIELALRVAETGKIGAAPAHPLILKSFAPLLAGRGRPAAVRGGFTPTRLEKAMDETAPPEMQAAYEGDPADGAADAGGATPTVQALYQLAQGLQDMKAQVEDMLAGSEHVKGKKFATKLLADLDDTITDATEMAAKIEAELGATDAAPDAEPESEPEPDTEPDDTEPDDDGMLKAIARRPRVLKAIRRFKLAEIQKAQTVAPAPAPAAAPVVPSADPAEITAEYLADLQRTDPKAYRRIEREARDFQRALR